MPISNQPAKNRPALKVTLEWVPAGDQLPDSDLTVLIALVEDEVWMGYLDGDIWREISGAPIEATRVTYWAHLPAAPG